MTAHCANPGSMMGLADEGMKIWLEPNDDPKKKLKWAWRLVDHGGGHFTGVDTGAANRVLKDYLIQAAHHVGTTGSHRLRDHYERVMDRGGRERLGTAKMLVRILRVMVTTESVYLPPDLLRLLL